QSLPSGSCWTSCAYIGSANRIVAALLADLAVCAFGISTGLRREERPSDFVAAGGAAPMDRLIAAAIGRSDRNAPVVTALGAIPGEVNGHIRSLTPSGGALKRS
ncbi:MAG TPA: hypothetical protein VFS81_28845, partial [Candidatus Binatia bacterium]|nr:hypothetical protein [Candidatus Binatia bacterium]